MARLSALSPAVLYRRAIDWPAALSIVALLIMMTVTFVSVLTRYLFNMPLLGNNEIVQLMAVSLAMLGMPYATLTEAHVRVDVLDRKIGRYGRFIGDIVARCLAGFVLVVILQRSWLKMLDTITYGDATNMLRIPLWPFYGLILIGMGLYLAILAVQLFEVVAKGPRHDS